MNSRLLKSGRHPGFAENVDMLIALAALLAMAVFLYGLRPLVMVVIAVATAVITDILVARLRLQTYNRTELSSVVFAVMFVLMLPASISYYIVVVGVVVLVGLGKHAFGGYNAYPFNPAAVGYAVVAVSWPGEVFRYPLPFSHPPVFGAAIDLVDAPAHILRMGGLPNIDSVNLLLGNYAGPMGATFILAIFAAAVYLLLRKRITFHAPLTMLLTCMIIAGVFPRVNGVSSFEVMAYELCSGALVFATIFLMNEPATSPRNPVAKSLYGVLLGVTTMIFRYFGAFELGVCFALLIANALQSYIDRGIANFTARNLGVTELERR